MSSIETLYFLRDIKFIYILMSHYLKKNKINKSNRKIMKQNSFQIYFSL